MSPLFFNWFYTMILSILLLIGVAYALICSLLYLFQEQMVFHPQPLTDENRQRHQSQAISYKHQDITLHGWYLPSKSPKTDPLIIYYGGNAEEVSWNIEHFQDQLPGSLLIINYRGYGDSEGQPTELSLKADALALFDHAQQYYGFNAGQIMLMGRSLGTGIATYVASQREVRGVILVTAYDSLADVASGYYPWLPINTLLRHRFESDQLAPSIQVPMLNLMAGNDHVIPPERAEQLAKHWQGPVTNIRIESADHISIVDYPAYWQAIHQFIQRFKIEIRSKVESRN